MGLNNEILGGSQMILFQQQKSHIKKIFALLICSIIVFSSFTVGSVKATSSVKKNYTAHDIAIVFDNSGSMYENRSWSQALYAIQVFASMLDYKNGDRLSIYPMRTITIGKGGEKISKRFVISGDKDVKKISKIYTPNTSQTILKPAYDAATDLKKSKQKEKWLIVLTDGAFYYDKDTKKESGKKPKSKEWLEKKLNGFSNNSGGKIKVQYIGLSNEAVSLKTREPNFYACNVDKGEELISALVKICNRIFNRKVVNVNSNGEFKIDFSMNNIIAFVQGKGADINATINKKSGSTIAVDSQSQLESGKEGTGAKRFSAPIDYNLLGKVVTYGECSAGDYQIDYSGSDLQLFYEPNVEIKTTLTNDKGKEVKPGDTIPPGEYKLNYGLVDGKTGADLSNNSTLIFRPEDAKVKNGKNETKVSNGGKVKLDADSNTLVIIKGTYLNEYTISNEDDPSLFAFNVKMPEQKGLTVKVDTEQSSNWFKLSDHSEWKPIDIDVKYDGKLLSGAQAENVKLDIDPKSSDDFNYKIEKQDGTSKYKLLIGKNKNGEYIEPKTGSYDIQVTATYKDKYGREIKNADSKGIDIASYSKFWQWLFWLLVIAALVVLTVFILTRKAWPRKMRFVVEKPTDDNGRKINIRIRSNRMNIIPYNNALSCSAEKSTNLYTKIFKPKYAKVKVSNFKSNELIRFSLGNNSYIADRDFRIDSCSYETITNGTKFQMIFEDGTKASGHIEIS